MGMYFDSEAENVTEDYARAFNAPKPPEQPGLLKRAGMGLARGYLKMVKGFGVAVAPVTTFSDEDRESWAETFTGLDEAIKKVTPDPHSVGLAGHLVDAASELPGQLVLGPAGLVNSVVMNTGADLVDQGVDAKTATGVAIGTGVVTGGMMMIPGAGKTVTQTAAAVAAQPVLGAGQRGATKFYLEGQGYNEQAKMFDPFDPKSLITDTVLATVFGVLGHQAQKVGVKADANISSEQVRDGLPVKIADALDTVANHQKARRATPFDEQIAPETADVHLEALDKALEDVTQGLPVDVSTIIVRGHGEPQGADMLAAREQLKALADKGETLPPEELKALTERAYGTAPPYRSTLNAEETDARGTVKKELEQLVKPAEPIPLQEGQLTHHDTPEIIKAREALSSIKSTHEINTPERQQLREAIANDLYGIGAAVKNREAFIVLGPPASGKSTVAEPLARQVGGLIIDSDMAKERLPEYGKGEGAGAVHRESDMIRGDVFNKALDAGDNVIMPLVGRTADNIRELKQLLQDEGYTVHLRLVDLHPEKAAERAVARFNETGRFVDPHYIVNEVGLLPRENYSTLKHEGGWKTYEAHSTYVAHGASPKLLEAGPASESSSTDAGRVRTEPYQHTEGKSGQARSVDPAVSHPQTEHSLSGSAEHPAIKNSLDYDVDTLLAERGDMIMVTDVDANGNPTAVSSARQLIAEAKADIEKTQRIENAYKRAALCLGLD